MTDATQPRYTLCGWLVQSCMRLPELLPWTGPSLEPDVCVESLQADPSTGAVQGFFRVDPDGTARLRVAADLEFIVSADAARVRVWHRDGFDPLLVRAHLYGSVLAILCFRRGLLPLHASCVRLGDVAVLFCGESGAGKSTLAAALARAGHAFLCDDVSAVDLSDPARPVVRPAFPRVKLLGDAMELFALEPAAMQSNAAAGAKFHYGVTATQQAEPTPIAALYELAAREGMEAGYTALGGSGAFLLLRRNVHRAAMGEALGCRAQIFHQLSVLARAIPISGLTRPNGLDLLGDTVNLLERTHGAVGTTSSALQGLSV